MKKLLIVIPLVAMLGCTAVRQQPVYTEVPPGSGNIVSSSVPVHVVDPKFEATINGLKATNQASAPINPFAGLIDYALGGALLIATAIAKRKNDQAKLHSDLLTTVIQGVENTGDSAAPVKASIRQLATLKGHEAELGVKVAAITE